MPRKPPPKERWRYRSSIERCAKLLATGCILVRDGHKWTIAHIGTSRRSSFSYYTVKRLIGAGIAQRAGDHVKATEPTR